MIFNESEIEEYSPLWVHSSVEDHSWWSYFTTEYYANKRYSQNDQYLKINPDGLSFKDPFILRHTKNTMNLYTRTMRLYVSKLWGNSTVPAVTPYESAGDDASSSPISALAMQQTAAIEKLWVDQKMRKVLLRVGFDHFLAGHSFADVGFDKDVKKKKFFSSRKYFDKASLVNPRGSVGGEGEVYIENLAPDMVIPDELATNMDNCRHIIIRRRVPSRDCEILFGLERNSLLHDTTSDSEANYQRLAHRPVIFENNRGQKYNASTVLYELRVRPMGNFKGLHRFCTKDKVLWESKEWPEWKPLIHRFAPFTGAYESFFSLPPGTLIRDLQKEINKTLSMISENKGAMGWIKILNKMNSVQDKNQLTDTPGWLDYVGEKPELLQPQGLPNYIVSSPDVLADYMLKVLGLTNPGSGELGPRMTGTANVTINTLLEQEMAYFAVDQEERDDFISEIVKSAMREMIEHYSEERIASVSGYPLPETVKFKADTFTDNMSIHVVAGTVGKSQQMMKEENFNYLDKGFIGADQFWRATILDHNNLRPQINEIMADYEKARYNLNLILSETGQDNGVITGAKWLNPDSNEQQNMLLGMVTKWANIDAHRKVFKAFVNSPAFMQLHPTKQYFMTAYLSRLDELDMVIMQENMAKQQLMQQRNVPPSGDRNIYEDREAKENQQMSPGPIPGPQTQTVPSVNELAGQGGIQ